MLPAVEGLGERKPAPDALSGFVTGNRGASSLRCICLYWNEENPNDCVRYLFRSISCPSSPVDMPEANAPPMSPPMPCRRSGIDGKMVLFEPAHDTDVRQSRARCRRRRRRRSSADAAGSISPCPSIDRNH